MFRGGIKNLVRFSHRMVSKNPNLEKPDAPEEFQKKIYDSFRKSKYNDVVEQIDKSEFRSNLHMKRLKLQALNLSMLENAEYAKLTFHQIKNLEKQLPEPFIAKSPLESVFFEIKNPPELPPQDPLCGKRKPPQ